MQLKIGAYLRVSTEEQAQVVEGSLDSQKYRISEFVKARCAEKQEWGKKSKKVSLFESILDEC